MIDALEQLRKYTKVVADSCDPDALAPFTSLHGVTTNPTLVMQALNDDNYPDLIFAAAAAANEKNYKKEQHASLACDLLLAYIAEELHRTLGAQISIEVDARLSFDTEATIERANQISEFCHDLGLQQSDFLIKIAATPQGIEAARMLEHTSIYCNLTLVFHLTQAIACAEAGVTLISPFVGRVRDWHVKYRKHRVGETPCPGVELVKSIHGNFARLGAETVVMGASFRDIDQIIQLCGCDLLTISPTLLHQLQQSFTKLAPNMPIERNDLTPDPRSKLAAVLEADPMTSNLLQSGIDKFIKDQKLLEDLMMNQFAS